MVRSKPAGFSAVTKWPSVLACIGAIAVAGAAMGQSQSPLDRTKTRLPANPKPLPTTRVQDAQGRMGLNKPMGGSNDKAEAAAEVGNRAPSRVVYSTPPSLAQMEGRPLRPGQNAGTGVQPNGELSAYRQETAQSAQDRLQQALRSNGFSDVQVGARVRTGAGSPIRETPRDVQQTQLEREALSRAPAPGALADQMDRQIAQTGASMGLEAARKKYAGQGYTEVQLGPGDTAFVRGSEDSIRRLQASRDSIRDASMIPVAAPQPRCGTHRAAVLTEPSNNVELAARRIPCEPCCCDEDGRRAVVSEGTYAEGPNPNGDQFIRTGTTITPTPAPDSPEAQARDPMPRGDAALRAGKLEEAVSAYSEYLSVYPDDTHAQRLKAIALLLEGKTSPGVEALTKAYTTDPSLAFVPVSREQLPEKGDALRKAVVAAVGMANRATGAGGGGASLAAAVLMQIEGRTEPAAKMAAKAAERGLDPGVVRELTAALAAK